MKMSSFAEFLKRRSWTSRKRNIILVKDLGEWAWEEYYEKTGGIVCYNIAVACLGEAEVRKRLGLLEKKKAGK